MEALRKPLDMIVIILKRTEKGQRDRGGERGCRGQSSADSQLADTFRRYWDLFHFQYPCTVILMGSNDPARRSSTLSEVRPSNQNQNTPLLRLYETAWVIRDVSSSNKEAMLEDWSWADRTNFHLELRNPERLAEADDWGRRHCSRSQTSLLSTFTRDRLQ